MVSEVCDGMTKAGSVVIIRKFLTGSLGDGSVVTCGGGLKISTGPQEGGTVALTCSRRGSVGKERCRREGKRSGVGPGALCERSKRFLVTHLGLRESVVFGLRKQTLHFSCWMLFATFTSPHLAHLFVCSRVAASPAGH